MPSAPQAPDPYATANAQANANKQAVYDSAGVNQINQVTPYGSQSYSGTIGSPDRTVTTTFSPQEQAKYDLLNSVVSGIGGQVQNLVGQIGSQQPLSFNGLPQRQFGGAQTNIPQASKGPDPSARAAINASYSDAFNKAGMSEGDFVKTPEFAGFQAKLNDYYNTITDPSEIASQLAYQQGRVNDPLYGASAKQFVDTLTQRQQDTKNKFYGSVLPITTDVDRAGPAVRTFGNAGQIQQGLQGTDPSQSLQQAEDAIYNRQTARLDPQFQKSQQDLETQLANQGITATSNPEAYYRAMDEFNQNKNDAYSSARNDSITAGTGLQNQLFGQNLAGAQFGNQAQQQAYDQLLGRASFYNTGQGQQFGQNLAGGQFQNQAQGQAFDQTLQGLNFGNTWNRINQQDTNSARDSMINEMLTQQQLPYSQLSQLMGYSSAQLPQFGAPAQYQMQSPDIGGYIMGNYNTQMSGRNALINALGSAAGAAGSAAIMHCWVARAAYGADNPKWLRAREWMLTKAPKSLLAFYEKHGPAIADYIADKPRWKALFRDAMDDVLVTA